jgi:phosphohistidine swiveling domain-containing protein
MIVGLNEAPTGSKAKSLSLADAFGIGRPKGFVVSGRVLEDLLTSAQCLDDLQSLFMTKDLSARKRAESLIYNLLNGSAALDQIVFEAARLSPSVAVRSSFRFEDDPDLTFAGIFESELPVVTNVHHLCQSLVRVWASAGNRRFLEKVNSRTEIRDLDILIHEYIELEWLGVAFSQDPTGLFNSATIIEAGTPNGGIVSGGAHGVHRLVVDRQGKLIHEAVEHSCQFNRDFVPGVVSMVASLATMFSAGVDVEWGITKDKELILLQARSISKGFSVVSETESIISFDSASVQSLRISPNYRKLVNWYWDKRRTCNLVCTDVGVGFQRYVLARTSEVSTNPGPFLAHIAAELGTSKVLLKFDTPQIMDNSSSLVVDKEALPQAIAQALVDGKLGDWFVAKSFFEADVSGLASLIGEDLIVEAAPGDIGGVLQGDTAVASFCYRPDGGLLSSVPRVFDAIAIFDPVTLKMVSHDVTPFLLEISVDARVKIGELTTALSRRFGECRVEWMLCGDRIVFYDLSLEQDALAPAVRISKEQTVISPGWARAPLVVLTDDDITALREGISRRLSVLSSVSELSDLERVDQAGIADKILGGRDLNQKPIVVAPFPDLNLVPLLNRASGFVFGSGAILSHFGIILRQAGLPAVIRPDAFELADGAICEFSTD